ncbi:MAG: tetratricopeptide repeat protein, partial [Elusimicrobiota bacterium]|nr:tetratricopeptide repeat protein [Elusimicrobiota bacterium]
KYYILATQLYNKTLKLADKYNALPDVKQGIKNDLSEVYLHLGVVEEKLGKLENSLYYYSEAIKLNQNFTKAYFNRAVIYWQKHNWKSVIRELELALSIDPNYQEARYYLELARSKSR